MRILVIGAGAVGGYFGGKLARAGLDVTFLVRDARFQQLERRGLRVHSVHGDFRLSPKMTQSVESIGRVDLVLVAVKTYHLSSVMSSIAALASQGARVLPLLNGVRHMEALRQSVPPGSLWGGVCYVESTLDDNGDVLQTSPMQEIRMGALSDDQSQSLSQARDAFTAAGVPAAVEEHIETVMWEKYLFLLTLSSVTASLRRPIGVALSDTVAGGFVNRFVKELTETAALCGAPIDHLAGAGILQKLNDIQPEMTSSMHRDLEKGRPIELDELQGYMVRLAQSQGVQAPLLETVYSLLHPYKDGIAVQTPAADPKRQPWHPFITL